MVHCGIEFHSFIGVYIVPDKFEPPRFFFTSQSAHIWELESIDVVILVESGWDHHQVEESQWWKGLAVYFGEVFIIVLMVMIAWWSVLNELLEWGGRVDAPVSIQTVVI
jgi:hypothetical protein